MRTSLARNAAGFIALAFVPLLSADTITTISGNTVREVATFGVSSPAYTNVASTDTSQTFTDFLSSGAPAGSILQSVDISVGLSIGISSLEITNLDNTIANAVPEAFYYLAQGAFGLAGSAPTTDLNSLATGLPGASTPYVMFSVGDSFFTGKQSIDRNQVFVYIGTPAIPAGGVQGTPDPSLIGAYSANESNGLGGTTDLPSYAFTNSIVSSALSSYNTTGTFNLAYATAVNLQLIGSGGNVGFSQQTTTSGTFEVDYNYALAGSPEPSTWLLMGSALLAAFFVFRRRVGA